MAVDLASGCAAFVVAYALYFSKPTFPVNVSWIATDYNGTEAFSAETIPSLKLFNEDPLPQFEDRNHRAVYFGDSVYLHSLSKREYNGLQGMLRRKDPKAKDRYEVFIARGTMMGKPISVKASNIERNGRGMADPNGRTMAEAKAWTERPSILSGLLDRAVLLDIFQTSTWKNLNSVEGKCAIVTCTHLLRMIGQRVPDAWQDCMKLASKLLRPGGAFITYDRFHYGNVSIMKQYEADNALGLSFVDPLPKKIFKKARQLGKEHKLMIWIKQ